MAVGSVWNGGVHAPQALVLMIAVIPKVSQYSPTLIFRTLSDYENLCLFFNFSVLPDFIQFIYGKEPKLY